MKKLLIVLSIILITIGIGAFKRSKAVKQEAELWAAAGQPS